MGSEIWVYNEVFISIHTCSYSIPEINISSPFKLVYSTHDAPNYIFSEDPTLIEYTKQWMHKLGKRSTLLSAPSAIAERKDYFRILQNKVDISRKRAEGLINREQEIF